MAEGMIQQAQYTSERLRRLYELALTVAGNPVEVFDQIVKIIAEIFHIRVALVEKIEGDKIKTLSMYLDGKILHEGVFDLAGTPCANVHQSKSFCSFNAAARRFPQDKFLIDYNIESYIGMPVVSAEGEVIAIINAMNDHPINLGEEDVLFLKAMASRVRLELEREQQSEIAIENARLSAELSAANERLLENDERKSRMITELSTPVIPVWDRVLLAPVIGPLDGDRAEQITKTLLMRAAETHAQVVILDITGVRTIDTDAAQHVINTVDAVRVLGASCIVTGIRATVAQTIVHLGIKLEGILMRRKLSDGLQLALDIIEREK